MNQPLPSGRTDYQDKDHLGTYDPADLKKRFLPTETCLNTRDLGGYKTKDGRQTKWGKLIRSEALFRLTDSDKEYMDSLGLTYIFDFRDPPEAKRLPDYIPAGSKYENLPILEGLIRGSFTLRPDHLESAIYDHMRELYELIVENRAQAYTPALRVLSEDEDAKILFHCTNGKDRTGFFAALLLLIAGVDEDTIVNDYLLTNLNIDEACAVFGPKMSEDIGVPAEFLRDFFGVHRDWIQTQLDYIRSNYGSVTAYLLDKTDLSEEEINRIKENITEDPVDIL